VEQGAPLSSDSTPPTSSPHVAAVDEGALSATAAWAEVSSSRPVAACASQVTPQPTSTLKEIVERWVRVIRVRSSRPLLTQSQANRAIKLNEERTKIFIIRLRIYSRIGAKLHDGEDVVLERFLKAACSE
jgi:hypothetical protein